MPVIPDGYSYYIGHTNNVIGSSLAVYPDGRAAYRRLDGRVVRFIPSTRSIQRLNAALQKAELISQLKHLSSRSSRYMDSEEWSMSFDGGSYQIACGRVEIPTATRELIDASRDLARAASDEVWFLGPEPKLQSTPN